MAFAELGGGGESTHTGYDDDGDTLIGWSMFQEHLNPVHDTTVDSPEEMSPPTGLEDSGYFRKDRWFPVTWGLLTLELDDQPDNVLTFGVNADAVGGSAYAANLGWAFSTCTRRADRLSRVSTRFGFLDPR